MTRQALNLVVITLDTTRADRLGAYGFSDVETPNLDRLARDGVLFEQAIDGGAADAAGALAASSPAAFRPSTACATTAASSWRHRSTTLATVLKTRGFQTGAVVGAYVLDGKWGLNQGFDTYVDDFDLSKMTGGFGIGDVQRPGNEVVDRALPWLEKVKDRRFFAWLHFYDAHTPYQPPEPFKSRYRAHPYSGEIAFVDSQVARVVAFLAAEPAARQDGHRGHRRPRRGPEPARGRHARLLHLREHHARAVHHPRAVRD